MLSPCKCFAPPGCLLARCPLPALRCNCADPLILRRFLSYALTEETPGHSRFTVFRKRLPQEVFQAAHEVVPEGLRTHGLLKGRHPGIDSSVIEANASLSELVQRNTEKSYWDYVKEPAKEAGVDPADPAAVARFDRSWPGRKSPTRSGIIRMTPTPGSAAPRTEPAT